MEFFNLIQDLKGKFLLFLCLCLASPFSDFMDLGIHGGHLLPDMFPSNE